MATTTQRNPSGSRSGGARTAKSGTKSGSSKAGSAKNGGKRASGGSGSRGARAANTKRPIRREVTGIVFLVVALCTLVSCFNEDGWLIALLPKLLKGLFGAGFYMVAPALAVAGWNLLTHRGRPVILRTTTALLSPVVFGSIWHMLFCRETFEGIDGVIGKLWSTGFEVLSGGVISGGIAKGSMAALGRTASVVIFSILLFAIIMGAFHVSLSTLVELWRSREHLDYRVEDYEDEDEEDYAPVRPRREPRRPAAPVPEIDIPLDGEEPPKKKEKGGLVGFFRPRAKAQLTPADVVMGQEPASAPAPQPAPVAFDPEPMPEPIPAQIPEPIFDPDPMPEPMPLPIREPEPAAMPMSSPAAEPQSADDRSKKKTAAQEVENATAQVTAEIESSMADQGEAYAFPTVDLLNENTQNNFVEAGAELRANAQRLTDTLHSFGVEAAQGEVVRGPAVTRYEFTLDQGVKLSKVTNLTDDIALALGASGVRIAPIPDKLSVVGIEVPNKTVSPVLIRDVIASNTFTNHKSPVSFAVGRDIGNRNIVGDIAKLPHVLIAGTTGSGKSVCTNSLIVSLLYKSSPEDVRFIMVDPKMVELAPYNGIPHLLIPVVTDPKKAAGALQWAVFEMMKRYKIFSELGVKKLEEYNAIAATREDLPHMASVVVVIDELADLMLVAAKEVEESICRVAQMGRAAGMHLVIATQRPSADVITGLMKANIPSRIAFAVSSSLESRIILDNTGAEKLVGRGDMLYAPLGIGKPMRVQGCFISPEEIERVVAFVKSTGEAQYSDEVMKKIEESIQEKDKKGGSAPAADAHDAADEDELLPAAVEVVLETGQASVSMLQRRLKLGYSRAARLVDQMEDRGYVGPFEGSKPRQLLITKEKWQEIKMGSAGGGGEDSDDAPWDDGEHVIPWEDQ